MDTQKKDMETKPLNKESKNHIAETEKPHGIRIIRQRDQRDHMAIDQIISPKPQNPKTPKI